MTVTFDEMPGLAIDGGSIIRDVTFQGVTVGTVSKHGFKPWKLYTVIPAPEQQKIATLVNNYVASQRVAARLRS